MKSPEYYIELFFMDDDIHLEKAIEEAQKEAYNQGLIDALASAEVIPIPAKHEGLTHIVKPDSILKLLKK